MDLELLIASYFHPRNFPVLHSIYCKVERNGTREIAAPIARPDHRKSKFGLRHRIKLIELYTVFNFFLENLRNPAHNRCAGLMRQFSFDQLYSSTAVSQIWGCIHIYIEVHLYSCTHARTLRVHSCTRVERQGWFMQTLIGAFFNSREI